MKKNILFAFALLINITYTSAQQEAKTLDGKKVLLFEDGSWKYADNTSHSSHSIKTISKLELPKTNSTDTIIYHTGYSLTYNEEHEQANWVAYVLTKQETNKLFDRTNKFIPDPKVKSGTANDKDYSGSGYDRGHLAPAADMVWSSTAITESFYFSNMSPQVPAFNRGVWKKLEEQVRSWAIKNDSIYIVTGPVLTSGLNTIGENKVSVPNYFYKVILDYTEPDVKAIAFIIPNKGADAPLQSFAVTIDSVEQITNIDFFPKLPDAEETTIEKTLCINCWSWKQSKSSEAKEHSPTTEGQHEKHDYIEKTNHNIKPVNKTGN